MRRVLYLVVVLILATLVGCGSSSSSSYGSYGSPAPAPAPAAQPDKNTVIIKDMKFTPATLNIAKGETVTWINQDAIAHTATGKAFDSKNMAKDATFKFTFTDVGSFDYICTYHPTMKGTIAVK